MYTAAIIYTCFLRDGLSKRTIQSIIDNRPNESMLIIGDQGYKTESKNQFYASLPDWVRIIYLPFDCGLSFARNELVKYARSYGCSYCVISADSIEFTSKYNFNEVIEFLDSIPQRGVIGLSLNNRIKWEYDLALIKDMYFALTKPSRPISIYKGIAFIPCDIVRNFYIAKTKCLLDVKHDESLKLCEHEDIMYRRKEKGWLTYYTDSISANYIKSSNEEYNKYRKGRWSTYVKMLKDKYSIRGWTKVV